MILELLKKRYSAREFLAKSIPDEVVREMLEAARLSPSGGNEQAWAFGVITDRDMIRKVAEVSHYNRPWMVAAPLLVVLCTRIVDVEPDPASRSIRFPELTEGIRAISREVRAAIYMEEHQVKIPGTQMAMVALEHGIQCTWVSHFKVKAVAQVLQLPERYLPSNLLVFGYPKGTNPTEGGQQRKRDLQDIVFYNTGEDLPPADQVPHWKWV